MMFAQANDAVYLVHPSQQPQSWWEEKKESKRKIWDQMPSETWNMEWGSSTACSNTYSQKHYPNYYYEQAAKFPAWSSAAVSAPYNGATMQECNSDAKQGSVPDKKHPTGTTPDGAEMCEPCGELPSIGSVGHADGSCKRCAFFSKGRCRNGYNCDHCHFDHPNRKRTRKLQGSEKSMEQKEEMVNYYTTKSFEEALSDFIDESDQEEVIESEDASSELAASASEELDVEEEQEECVEEEQVQDEHSQKLQPVCTAEEAARRIQELEAALAAARVEYELQMSAAKVSEQALKEHEVAHNTKYESSSSLGSTSIGASSDCDSPPGSPKQMSKDHSPASSSASSPTSFAAQARLRRLAQQEGKSIELSPTEVGRKARCLLNKLTEERFESICAQILALPMTTPDHLRVVVAEIFEKATTEQGFLTLYTELCLRLDLHFASKDDELVGGKAFRRAIITSCQSYFERTFQEPIQIELCQELDEAEIFEQQMKLKTKCLGNMRFIGKLLVEKLLAGKILMPVLSDMLDVGTDASLESLSVLLSVVGPHFEQKPLFAAPLKETFVRLQHASKDSSLPLRVRCLLCDLLEERARGWVPRSAVSPKSKQK